MPPLERPICEYNGIGGCARPATHVVCFHLRRWRLSCDSHKEKWKGAYWIGSLLGWKPDAAAVQGEWCDECQSPWEDEQRAKARHERRSMDVQRGF